MVSVGARGIIRRIGVGGIAFLLGLIRYGRVELNNKKAIVIFADT